MTRFWRRLALLMWGLFLYALGIALTIRAQIGYAPWDTFHVGVANTLGITIGTASISVGIMIMVVTALLREKVGLGSILNMFAIGLFLDLILGLVPTATSTLSGVVMLIAGLIVISFASYFYIASGFGAGPRDSLMVALTRQSGLPIGVCRIVIEGLALICGWKLGGMVGLGTVLSAFLTGFFVQLTFRLLGFDVTKIQHETIAETYLNLKLLALQAKKGRHPS